VLLYLESFGNPRAFARVAPAVARKKPIIAMASGRSAAGKRAATSHSAALANLDVAVDALFQQAGVIRAETLEELFDAAVLLSSQPLPAGPRVGVITNAGGPGILFADACESAGLTLPVLGKKTIGTLRAFLPPQAGLSNPVDLLAQAGPGDFERAIEAVGADKSVDALVAIYVPPRVSRPAQIAAAIAAGTGKVPRGKPVAAVFLSSEAPPPRCRNAAGRHSRYRTPRTPRAQRRRTTTPAGGSGPRARPRRSTASRWRQFAP
jgi:acyl-CoA synthetase (NDP forming)